LTKLSILSAKDGAMVDCQLISSGAA
jgi:hypothetical protein